jgi:hypothetical protein
MIPEILRENHDDPIGSHLGFTKTYIKKIKILLEINEKRNILSRKKLQRLPITQNSQEKASRTNAKILFQLKASQVSKSTLWDHLQGHPKVIANSSQPWII